MEPPWKAPRLTHYLPIRRADVNSTGVRRHSIGKAGRGLSPQPLPRLSQQAQRFGCPGCPLMDTLESYRRLTPRMLDTDIVAVSPASLWRVLSQRSAVLYCIVGMNRDRC